jgi:hypothetical protein
MTTPHDLKGEGKAESFPSYRQAMARAEEIKKGPWERIEVRFVPPLWIVESFPTDGKGDR